MKRDDDSLDPQDWKAFREQAHRVLDDCIDRLEHAREHPWRPVPTEVRDALSLGDANDGVGTDVVAREMVELILPYATGNTHPRWFGWVHGTGLVSGLLSEMVAATMNSNCGGRDHGAAYVEREVISWCKRVFDFPETASGVLVAGTSQATVVALAVARQKALGDASRKQGICHDAPLTAYAVMGVHNAIVKALELLGLGSEALRRVPADSQTGGMNLIELRKSIAADRAHGKRPFCIIGTAGSVDSGAYDDLDALATICAEEKLWLHVDGAFGAWTKIAEDPWNLLSRGIERADSLATDFHKWMYVQYDCGLVLIRDEKDHRAAFAARPAYLAGQAQGVGGGEPWFCDYGTDLSRGFRALKVWTALRCYGRTALGRAITRNCELARLMGDYVSEAEELRLVLPVQSNLCCFSVVDDEHANAWNTQIAQELQMQGEAVFSTTKINGLTVMRAAITNHRTRPEDIRIAIDAVRTAFIRLKSSPSPHDGAG